MIFNYSSKNLKGRQWFLQRVLEIIPGATSWSILTGTTILSVSNPKLAAIFIILFYLFWLFRVIYSTLFLGISYYRLRMEKNTDWIKRIKGIDHLAVTIGEMTEKIKGTKGFREKLGLRICLNELTTLALSNDLPCASSNIYHVVIYPVIKEEAHILEAGIQSLANQPFPTKQMIVIFALEERSAPNIKDGILMLIKKYKDIFNELLVVIHPSDIPGEARVKGANVTYAAKETARILKQKNIAYENVIVSCFDADTVVSPQYFACLTYQFMVTPGRIQKSYQPIPVYHNNIWDVPAFARILEIGSSFHQLVEAAHPQKLVTFSSHSMSFKSLVDVNFWPVDMISDDSAIYWKSLLYYEGQYSVVPIYTTLSMDIVASSSLRETAKFVYKQKRRWAWGVENFPIVIRGFLAKSTISLRDKLRLGFKLFDGNISWATYGFLLSFIGWLPAFFAKQIPEDAILYYNVPRVAITIFHMSIISLFTAIIISMSLLPKPKSHFPAFKKIQHAFEWLTIPFILVFFNALPALDAQTRLMLGKYMEFWVATKRKPRCTS